MHECSVRASDQAAVGSTELGRQAVGVCGGQGCAVLWRCRVGGSARLAGLQTSLPFRFGQCALGDQNPFVTAAGRRANCCPEGSCGTYESQEKPLSQSKEGGPDCFSPVCPGDMRQDCRGWQAAVFLGRGCAESAFLQLSCRPRGNGPCSGVHRPQLPWGHG